MCFSNQFPTPLVALEDSRGVTTSVKIKKYKFLCYPWEFDINNLIFFKRSFTIQDIFTTKS